MITVEMINECKEDIVRAWGKAGEKIIAECEKLPSLNMSHAEFSKNCIPATRYWSPDVILSGIEKLRPSIRKLIPDDLGVNCFIPLGAITYLCGVDGTK